MRSGKTTATCDVPAGPLPRFRGDMPPTSSASVYAISAARTTTPAQISPVPTRLIWSRQIRSGQVRSKEPFEKTTAEGVERTDVGDLVAEPARVGDHHPARAEAA